MGHRVFFRGENTAVIEEKKTNGIAKKVKTFWMSQVVFKLADGFFAVGKQNMAYYKMMGVPENKMTFTPHCIDNQRFMAFREEHKNEVLEVRKRLGIPLDKKVIISSGKYIDKKRPLDLLRALAALPSGSEVFTVFVGEGNLREEMEGFIEKHGLKDRVMLTGFVNQTQMPYYYLASDVYVMSSGMYETWGLSTNEAMCFGLPVILSDMVGSAYDLIAGNGYMYPSGDWKELSGCIDRIFSVSPADFEGMRERSRKIIERYSYDAVVKGILLMANGK